MSPDNIRAERGNKFASKVGCTIIYRIIIYVSTEMKIGSKLEFVTSASQHPHFGADIRCTPAGIRGVIIKVNVGIGSIDLPERTNTKCKGCRHDRIETASFTAAVSPYTNAKIGGIQSVCSRNVK